MISATTEDLSEGSDFYQPGIAAGVFIPTRKTRRAKKKSSRPGVMIRCVTTWDFRGGGDAADGGSAEWA
jgi:hypothetical protein